MKNRWLLAGLVAIFLAAGLISAVSTLGPGPDSADRRAAEGPDLLDSILLVYGDGLYRVAGHYLGRDMHAEAEPLLRRVLWIRESILGPRHVEVGDALERYAKVLAGLGRAAESESMAARAAEIRALPSPGRRPISRYSGPPWR